MAPMAVSATLAIAATTGVVQSRVLPMPGTTTSTATTSTSSGATTLRAGASPVVASRIDNLTIRLLGQKKNIYKNLIQAFVLLLINR